MTCRNWEIEPAVPAGDRARFPYRLTLRALPGWQVQELFDDSLILQRGLGAVLAASRPGLDRYDVEGLGITAAEAARIRAGENPLTVLLAHDWPRGYRLVMVPDRLDGG